MTEIWVPYGPVDVSFDIKQENLSHILEPRAQKIPQDELEIISDRVSEENIVLLSGTSGAQKFLEILLMRNKNLKKIIYPKSLGALARRKALEYSIDSVQLSVDSSIASESFEKGISAYLPLLASGKMLILSSAHYDPLFGLSSPASEIISLVPEMKKHLFTEFSGELPFIPEKAPASDYSISLFQSLTQIRAVELVEKAGVGIIGLSYGEIGSTHSKTVDIWTKNLSVPVQKSERVIFGCGGGENDRNLTDAFSRALFPVLINATLPDSDAKICMLAECGHGLGSEAFLRFVTGRLEPRSKIGGVEYVDGLEVLLSFQKMQRDLQINILTTLPRFYAAKFDLKTVGGAREAPLSLVQPGSRAKILVIPDASSTSFRA
ncbi:MAG TPA: hypothetical protein VN739_02320 [Nitrososphaerales archaeon]|nr:hypothetical protein [Nitrososphaerales archaeon]